MIGSRGCRFLAVVGIATVLSSGLAGCGRRGGLLPPPDPNAPTDAEKARDGKPIRHTKPVKRPILPPNEPFVLDPIL